ncbi:MAG: hypothetical protein ACI4JK_10755 [Oscillospiraceae bacterium]
MSNKKKSISKQEFIQRYREADPATRYALEQSLIHYFAGKEKEKCNKEELAAYWNERIGEYNAYSKAMDAVNDEYAMAEWYIEQANAIANVALGYEGTPTGGINTMIALFGAIETALRSANEMMSKGGNRIVAIKMNDDLTETRGKYHEKM